MSAPLVHVYESEHRYACGAWARRRGLAFGKVERARAFVARSRAASLDARSVGARALTVAMCPDCERMACDDAA